MKIIHCADVHLGSKMDSRLPSEKAEERRRELRSSFSSLVNYAADNNVSVILLAGDVFDSDRPLKKDKEFFYNVVKNNPQIDFLYLRGNHDGLQSYEQSPDNLKCFSGEWRCYEYGNVAISGVEITRTNSQSIYSSLRLDESKLNIVTLHGQIGDSSGVDKVNLSKLRAKNIDYLALGHIHTNALEKLDSRGVYAYSGCLEGRGFDEDGEKGFYLLTADDKITAEFIPFSKRAVRIVTVDVSAANDGYAAYNLVKDALDCPKSDILRVVLTGEVAFDNSDLAAETQKMLLRENYYYAEVRDKTLRKLDISDYEGDISLKGEFVRLVLQNAELDDEKKREIISLGLKALEGRELDV